MVFTHTHHKRFPIARAEVPSKLPQHTVQLISDWNIINYDHFHWMCAKALNRLEGKMLDSLHPMRFNLMRYDVLPWLGMLSSKISWSLHSYTTCHWYLPDPIFTRYLHMAHGISQEEWQAMLVPFKILIWAYRVLTVLIPTGIQSPKPATFRRRTLLHLHRALCTEGYWNGADNNSRWVCLRSSFFKRWWLCLVGASTCICTSAVLRVRTSAPDL